MTESVKGNIIGFMVHHKPKHPSQKVVSFVMMSALMILLVRPGAAAERYRLSFSFSGQAQGKILIFFPFRFSYEAAAELELTAESDGQGGLNFSFLRLSSPGYVMRTLGFSGRAFVIVTAHDQYEVGEAFGKDRVADWQTDHPDYSKHVRKVKYLSFKVENTVPEAFVFHRNGGGQVSQAASRLRLHYKHHPQDIGIYFRVYALFSEILGLFNHVVWPDSQTTMPSSVPVEWSRESIDLSQVLLRMGAQTEKIVASAVKFDQKQPFSMVYRLVKQDDQITELVGRNQGNPLIWRNFRIQTCERHIIVQGRDALPLRDELRLLIGNEKGQGGGGYLLLERIDSDS